jgi:hypothetical protein
MGFFHRDKDKPEGTIEDAVMTEVEKDENQIFMSELDMKSLDLLSARAEMQIAVLDKFKLAEQLLLVQQRQQLAEIRNKQRDIVRSLESVKSEYNQYRIGVSERLGVDLDHYTVNDNGLLTRMEELEIE